ncbi:hypothetical protein ACQUF6_09120 [Streptomyces albidoflavus]
MADDAPAPVERSRTDLRRRVDASYGAGVRRARAERAASEVGTGEAVTPQQDLLRTSA